MKLHFSSFPRKDLVVLPHRVDSKITFASWIAVTRITCTRITLLAQDEPLAVAHKRGGVMCAGHSFRHIVTPFRVRGYCNGRVALMSAAVTRRRRSTSPRNLVPYCVRSHTLRAHVLLSTVYGDDNDRTISITERIR